MYPWQRYLRTVLKKIGKREVHHLPSLATVSQIAIEARFLANIEVPTAIANNRPEEALGNCLHGDGTSKHYKKYKNLK